MKQQGASGTQGDRDQPMQEPGGGQIMQKDTVEPGRGNNSHHLYTKPTDLLHIYIRLTPKEKVDFPTPYHNPAQRVQSQGLK